MIAAGRTFEAFNLRCVSFGVQGSLKVSSTHILTANLYYNYYYQNPKYLIIGYVDP